MGGTAREIKNTARGARRARNKKEREVDEVNRTEVKRRKRVRRREQKLRYEKRGKEKEHGKGTKQIWEERNLRKKGKNVFVLEEDETVAVAEKKRKK